MLLNCGAGEDSWESLGLQGDQPVHPKGNQSWIFIGRTDAKAEAPILWAPNVKNWLIGKDPDAGKDWRQEKKGTTEDEMVGWHHRLNGHECEHALGVGDEQGSLACCSPWGLKELDTTERLNWTEQMRLFNVKRERRKRRKISRTLMRQYQVYQYTHNENLRKKGEAERDRKTIWRQNGWKLSIFDGTWESIYSRISKIHKQKLLEKKEHYTYTYNSQTAKNHNRKPHLER